MFRSFGNRKPQKQHIENDAQDRIATIIVHRWIKAQELFATLMQRQTERLSGRIKRLLLAIFFLSASGYSLYLITESLISHRGKAFSIAPIKISMHTGKYSNEYIQPAIGVTKEDYQKIQRFQQYIDSLAQTSAGKKVKDKTLLLRPGLMDSIHFIENIYQLQSSKK